MKLSSKPLVTAIVSIGGCCVIGLMPSVVGAQNSTNNLPVSERLAQTPQSAPQSNNILARMALRISELENEIRRLTGQNEELANRLGLMEGSLKQAASDTALRLSALERGGNSGKGGGSATPPVGPDLGSRIAKKPATQPVKGADKGAKVLGTVRQNPDTAKPAQSAAVAKTESPKQQYDRAHSLIVKQRKYAEAERVLRSFIDGNPKHALASNAHYWLGRTYFVRADYENAAFAFAEGFQKFPEAKKAPANLLNLGMSLARLGKNREACTTYTRLLRTYKGAQSSIKRRITRERRRAKCRNR